VAKLTKNNAVSRKTRLKFEKKIDTYKAQKLTAL